MAGSDKMVDNVGGRGVSAGAAEPFGASQATDDAAGVVDATVAGGLSVGNRGNEGSDIIRAGVER
jgi:hypothetical protein